MSDSTQATSSSVPENPVDAMLDDQRTRPMTDGDESTTETWTTSSIPDTSPEAHHGMLDDEPTLRFDTESSDCELPATPAPAEDPALLFRMEELLGNHRDQLSALVSERKELEHTLAEQSAQIDSLRQKVEELTGDQVRALLLPPASRLVDVLASVRDTAKLDFSDLSKETMLRQHRNELEHVGTGVADALRSLGLSAVACDPGEKFNSRFHQAVGTTDTVTAELDKRIARVSRPGFTFPGAARPSIAPQVIVYKYVSPSEGA